MKNPYFKASLGMYINYFLLGMVNIILASNMSSLTEQWNTDPTGISYLIAAIGIGKLLTYGISGVLSDKIGRKPLIIFSATTMSLFLVAIPFPPVMSWLSFSLYLRVLLTLPWMQVHIQHLQRCFRNLLVLQV
jgi:MFS family permease